MDSDVWASQHRNKERAYSSTIYNSKQAPMKFFNGFSIGISGGLGWIHGDLVDARHFPSFDQFSTHYRFAYRVHAERQLKYGLGAKVQFEAGNLGGGRVTGKQSPQINFQSEYRTFALLATYDVLGELFRKDTKKQTKTYLNAELGVGITFFRAATFWTGEDERVRDFIGYTVTDINPPTQRYTLLGKASPEWAFNVPIGFTFGYRVNYKTDLTFNYTYNSLFTDELDAWSRDWSANDKYSITTIGLRYNFNRETDDYPRKKKKAKPESADKQDASGKWKMFGSKKENVAPNDVDLNGPVQARMGNKVDPAVENKELEEIRMKMFELQLKLFEMQYLLGGDKSK